MITKQRVPKSHILIELIGTIDEAESYLGFASTLIPEHMKKLIEQIQWMQELLFRIGFSFTGKPCIKSEDLETLENITDEYSEYVEPVFRLHGGHTAAAAINVARSIVRRLERIAVRVMDENHNIPYLKDTIPLLNRMSDALYAIASYINVKSGKTTPKISC